MKKIILITIVACSSYLAACNPPSWWPSVECVAFDKDSKLINKYTHRARWVPTCSHYNCEAPAGTVNSYTIDRSLILHCNAFGAHKEPLGKYTYFAPPGSRCSHENPVAPAGTVNSRSDASIAAEEGAKAAAKFFSDIASAL